MLKRLEAEHCNQLSDLLRRVEMMGDVPKQWTVSIMTMLPKQGHIERPIALLHTVYKAFIKLRWKLVDAWLERTGP